MIKEKIIKLKCQIINFFVDQIFSRSYNIAQLSRLIVEKYDNDSNPNLMKNGEFLLQKKISEFSSKNSLFIDVGCNRGAWSKALIKSQSKGTVICIDPISENLKEAKKILKCSNLKFKFLKKVISNRNNIVEFYINDNPDDASEDLSKSSLFNMEDIGYACRNKKVLIEAIKLDELFTKIKIKESRILFLKADVEGNEYKLMLGAKKLFKNKQIDFFQFEFGHAARAAKVYLYDIFNFFNNYDYKLFVIKRNGILPIKFSPFLENRYKGGNFMAVNVDIIPKCSNFILKNRATKTSGM